MKFNAFEIFKYKPEYSIDPAVLESDYVDLMARNHPDNFADNGNAMLIQASFCVKINEAYAILKDDIKRGALLLELNGFYLDGEKKNVTPNKDFLATMLDLSDRFHGDDFAVVDEVAELFKVRKIEVTRLFSENALENAGRCLLEMIYLNGLKKHSFKK